MIEKIKQDLTKEYGEKPHRLQHVNGVVETALSLGRKYQCNLEWLELAALLHDITKYKTNEYHIKMIQTHYPNADEIITEYNPNILHAFSAAVVAEKTYGIHNPFILRSIMHHTIGYPNMSLYEKIIFLSDYIEPNRTYESCVKVRKIAEESLDKAVYVAIDDSIKYHEEHQSTIPKTAYEARAYYQQKLEEQT